MALVIDGVAFQSGRPEAARLWRAALPLLVQKLDMPAVFLDRGAGGCAEAEGVEIVPFPSFGSKFNAEDSALLERFCRHYDAKAFLSTGTTTPLGTPSLCVIDGMAPERLGLDPPTRDRREKATAIAHARRHVCLSQGIREDLLKLYPELDPDAVTVAGCGVDGSTFKPRDKRAVAALRDRLGLARPYFVLARAPLPLDRDEGTGTFLDAVKAMGAVDFDLLSASGGEGLPDVARRGCRIVRADLDEDDLATAYSGAEALVCPALHDAPAMPMLEAMSSGCPVIAMRQGVPAEVAGDAALLVEGRSAAEMADAMRSVRKPALREPLSREGRRHAKAFRWQPFAAAVARTVAAVAAEGDTPACKAFYAIWARLRTMQGEVDILA